MNNIRITSNVNIPTGSGRKTILDNNLLLSSETAINRDLLRVDPVTNNVAIFQNTSATATLDVNGTVAVSNSLIVQNSKLVVNSMGRIGINNTTPTTDLTIQGDVYFEGSLILAGSLFTGTTSSLEILDTKVTLNKGGSNITANNAGITIERTSSPAQLIWDESRTNFKAGVAPNIMSFIKADGNTDLSNLTIGTNDNYPLVLKTNNTSRLIVGTNNVVTYTGDISIPTGDMLIQGISVKNGRMPPGTIISFIPGTFGNANNNNFTVRLGAGNSPIEVNTWLAANGYPHWKVCDGQSYTESQSLLYNALGPGANVFGNFNFNTETFGGGQKFTPNLTDDRFLAGFTKAGDIGGTNSFEHSHTLSAELLTTTLEHSHPTSAVSALNAETVSLGTYNSTTGACNVYTSWNGHAYGDHYHGLGDHTHGPGTLKAGFLFSSGSGENKAYIQSEGSLCSSFYIQMNGPGAGGPYPESWGHTEGTNVLSNTGGSSRTSSDYAYIGCTGHDHTVNHTHNVSHTHNMPSAINHNHSVTTHSHTFSTTPVALTSQFCHTHGTTTATNSMYENRPKYMTNFFIVKII